MTERQGKFEMEKTREKVMVLGRLKDLGLGNPEGIPSAYESATDEELQQIAERAYESLVYPDDLSCTACIDGRCTLHNADGSKARVRMRRVGGSASNLGVALNSEASVVDTFDLNAPLGEQIEQVDELIGYRSAHLGGCGGAGGETDDNRLINEKPAVLGAVETLMEVPVVKESLGVGFSDELAERVRENAGKTKDFLEASGWDGQAYVEGVKKDAPENVEVLKVDDDDHEFHGHNEPALLIIVGKKTMPVDFNGFVWNIDASKEVAEKMAGQRGQEGYQQALIAEIAKHMAVADRLPSEKTPVFLLVA